MRFDHMGDQKEIVVIGFEFGALMDTDNIFHSQRMNIKNSLHLPEDIGTTQTLDIDPDHRPFADLLLQHFGIFDGTADDFIFAVADIRNHRFGSGRVKMYLLRVTTAHHLRCSAFAPQSFVAHFFRQNFSSLICWQLLPLDKDDQITAPAR